MNHTELVCASDLHEGDVIVTEETTFRVRYARTRAGNTTISTSEGSWTVGSTYQVNALVKHDCDCGGTGIWYGHGHVENGVFRGQTGECFRCGGKGWQSREDVIRNVTYDNKYRRVQV